MMETTTDYSGRKLDLDIMGVGNPPAHDQRVTMVFNGAIGGIQTLAQRFMLALLTVGGAQRFTPSFGTQMASILGKTFGSGSGNLQATLDFENSDAVSTLKDSIRVADLADERLENASITRLTTENTANGLVVEITLESVAGVSYTYILPVSAETELA